MTPEDDTFDFDKNLDVGVLDEPAVKTLEKSPEEIAKEKEAEEAAEAARAAAAKKKKDDDDDDGFTFGEKKKTVKKKPTKEESLAELRKQRDDLKTTNDSFTSAIGDLDVGIIKQIGAFIGEQFKDDIPTEDAVIAFLDEAKESKKKVEEMEKELSDRDSRIKDLDIRSSKDFNDQYVEPLKAVAADLQVEIANIDPDSAEVLAPLATRKFHNELMKSSSLTSMKIKQMLTKFGKEFEAESGEKYEAPSVAAVSESYRKFKKVDVKMGEAYKTWQTEKKDAADRGGKLDEEKRLLEIKQGKDERRAGAIKGLRSFNMDLVEDFKTKEEIEKEFRAVFQENESLFDDVSNVPTYDILTQRTVKAKLFDEMAAKYKELLEWKKSQEEEDGDDSKGKGSKTVKDTGDWIDM